MYFKFFTRYMKDLSDKEQNNSLYFVCLCGVLGGWIKSCLGLLIFLWELCQYDMFDCNLHLKFLYCFCLLYTDDCWGIDAYRFCLLVCDCSISYHQWLSHEFCECLYISYYQLICFSFHLVFYLVMFWEHIRFSFWSVLLQFSCKNLNWV